MTTEATNPVAFFQEFQAMKAALEVAVSALENVLEFADETPSNAAEFAKVREALEQIKSAK